MAIRRWSFSGTGSAHPSTWNAAAANLCRALNDVAWDLSAEGRHIVRVRMALAGAGRAEDQARVIAAMRAGCPWLDQVDLRCSGDIEPLVDYRANGLHSIVVILGTGSCVASSPALPVGQANDGSHSLEQLNDAKREDSKREAADNRSLREPGLAPGGLAKSNEMVRAGGWGPLLGDGCSGGAIGLSALRFLSQLIDEGQRVEQFNELGRALVQEIRSLHDASETSLNTLLIQTASDRTQAAQLAGIVLNRAYRGSDRTALDLIEPHVADIVWQIRQVSRRCGVNDQPLRLNFAGGIAENHPLLRESIQQACLAAGLDIVEAEIIEPLQALLWSATSPSGKDPTED